MEIRDTRNGDWYWVNNIVLSCKSISLADKAVYSALATFSGFQEIRPTFKTIAERCNVGLRTAKESIKMLEAMGFINVENHGKKGVSNVYKLNKSTKGCVKKCIICTTKKCKPVQEEVQNTTKSSAVAAPQIDIHIDKDIDTTPEPSSEDNNSPHNKHLIPDIIRAFESINPAAKNFYARNPQRRAVQELLDTLGFERLLRVVENTLPKTNTLPYFPTITTPIQLLEKWSQLEAGVKKERSKIKSKGNVYW